MSTRYGYHCATCGESSPHWVNHGVDTLRKLHYHRATFVQAMMLMATPELWRLFQGFQYWANIFDSPFPVEFLAAHEGHELLIEDEYGRVHPMEPTP